MERPEYNKLRKMPKNTPGLIVDEAQNMMHVSLYDNGELKKVVVVMKCDSFLQSKSNIEKIMLLSSSIEDRKNKEKNKTKSENAQYCRLCSPMSATSRPNRSGTAQRTACRKKSTGSKDKIRPPAPAIWQNGTISQIN